MWFRTQDNSRGGIALFFAHACLCIPGRDAGVLPLERPTADRDLPAKSGAPTPAQCPRRVLEGGKAMHKHKVTAYLDADVARDLAALAARRRVAATRIVETAVASFLTPDSADQTEAAITRRLDRLTRTLERLERDQQITGEALALFIRFWLTATPPVPDDLREVA